MDTRDKNKIKEEMLLGSDPLLSSLPVTASAITYNLKNDYDQKTIEDSLHVFHKEGLLRLQNNVSLSKEPFYYLTKEFLKERENLLHAKKLRKAQLLKQKEILISFGHILSTILVFKPYFNANIQWNTGGKNGLQNT